MRISPEEQKIADHLGKTHLKQQMDPRHNQSAFKEVPLYEENDRLSEENRILKHNVKELQGQLQASHKRISELADSDRRIPWPGPGV